MKIPLTRKSIIEILKEWDIVYIKKHKLSGYVKPEDNKIIINADQSVRDLGITVFHEILHLHYENNKIFHTHLQIEMEARAYYYKRPDMLELIYSFL